MSNIFLHQQATQYDWSLSQYYVMSGMPVTFCFIAMRLIKWESGDVLKYGMLLNLASTIA